MFARTGKTIAVVFLFECLEGLFYRALLCRSKRLNLGSKVVSKLLFGKSTDGSKEILQGDVLQVIDATEEGRFAKLSNPR